MQVKISGSQPPKWSQRNGKADRKIAEKEGSAKRSRNFAECYGSGVGNEKISET